MLATSLQRDSPSARSRFRAGALRLTEPVRDLDGIERERVGHVGALTDNCPGIGVLRARGDEARAPGNLATAPRVGPNEGQTRHLEKSGDLLARDWICGSSLSRSTEGSGRCRESAKRSVFRAASSIPGWFGQPVLARIAMSSSGNCPRQFHL